MHKTRVYELAKKLNMSSKELINQLHDLGIDVKSHMSTLSDEQVEDILSVFEGEKEVKEEKKPEEKKEKEVIKGEEEKKIEKEKKEKEKKKEEKTQEEIKEITISAEDLTLDKLAQALGKKQNEIIKDMFMKRIMLKPYQKLDKKTAEEIALNYNVILEVKEEKVKEEEEKKELQDPEEILKKKWEEIYEQRKDDLKERPPVVTVMGHVDHGKTTLLDRIRNTRVAEREVGGITQSIGAYQIIYNNKKITFIDTPGHEAFTEMRARGAQATDIVVLVVAADDGVMPQTIEAYNHAKNAGVPIIVAINKIDKPNANVEMTKQELVSKLNIVPEDWGGDTITVPISAKLGKGIDDLLEMILLVAEMEEIKAIPDGKARGVIIESKLNKAMGPVATVIVKDGILKVGDYVVAGSTYGKVRRMVNPDGKDVKKAYPSDPVQIIGFEEVPDMHSMLYVVDNLEQARTYAERKKELEESKKKVGKRHMRLEDIMRMMQETKKKVLNLIIKADTFGASEALKNAIFKLKNPDIDIQIIHAGIGVVTTSDVMLASASDAIILGFRVKIDRKALQLAEREGVQIKRYDVIFNLIDDLKKALEGMLEPEEKEEIIGYGEIKEVFKIRKVGNVAGVQLTDGFVTKDSKVRLFRNGKLIYDGSIESLKHYKDDVNKVEAPKECGIKLQNYEDINRGDELEFYRIVKVKKELKFES